MMCRNRILALAILLFLAVAASAQVFNFVVWLKSGEQINLPLAEKPKVTQGDGHFIVSSDAVSVEVPISDIMKFTLETQDPGAVEGVESPGASLFQRDNMLVLKGFRCGSGVSVYTINGQLVLNENVTDATPFVVDLSTLNKGIYIVSTESITCKIVKR